LETQVTADFFPRPSSKERIKEDRSFVRTLEKSSLGKAIPENLEDRCQKEFARSWEIKVEVIIQRRIHAEAGGKARGNSYIKQKKRYKELDNKWLLQFFLWLGTSVFCCSTGLSINCNIV
jgi:hypothetical protein